MARPQSKGAYHAKSARANLVNARVKRAATQRLIARAQRGSSSR